METIELTLPGRETVYGYISPMCNPSIAVPQAEMSAERRGVFGHPELYLEIRYAPRWLRQTRRSATWLWRSLEGTN